MDTDKIICELSDQYDFYKRDLPLFMLANRMSGNKKFYAKLLHIKKTVVGFYTCRKIKQSMTIDFIFIIPEYRRKGYTSNIINQLKSKYDEVYINGIENDIMRKLATKLGFIYKNKCKDNVGDLYYWNKIISSSSSSFSSSSSSLQNNSQRLQMD